MGNIPVKEYSKLLTILFLQDCGAEGAAGRFYINFGIAVGTFFGCRIK